jgi:transposase
MANKRRDLAKERGWRDTLKRQAASGLSVRGFCRREKLAGSGFYAWRRIVAERDAEAKPTRQTSAFVPLTVVEQAPREASIEIELAGGRLLRLPATIAAARLAELVHALEGRASR